MKIVWISLSLLRDICGIWRNFLLLPEEFQIVLSLNTWIFVCFKGEMTNVKVPFNYKKSPVRQNCTPSLCFDKNGAGKCFMFGGRLGRFYWNFYVYGAKLTEKYIFTRNILVCSPNCGVRLTFFLKTISRNLRQASNICQHSWKQHSQTRLSPIVHSHKMFIVEFFVLK